MTYPNKTSTRISLVTLILYWILLFIGTHIPIDSEYLMEDKYLIDNWMHLVAFSVLTFLYFFTIVADRELTVWQYFLRLLPLVIYATIDEMTQPFTGRTADLHDWIANLIGIILALVIYGFFLRYLQKSRLKASYEHTS